MRRTTATTDYLKECMGTALLELMKEKPIEKTVSYTHLNIIVDNATLEDIMLFYVKGGTSCED